MRFGLIIQARMGSTRMPGKMGEEFSDGRSLMEVILDRLNFDELNIPVVLATSNNPNDDYLSDLVLKKGGQVFRGDENNVLKRFINAAEEFNIDVIIRVCGDNPFIEKKYIKELIDNYQKEDDYLSFRFEDGTPTIKSHIGLFAEIVSLNALRKVLKLTSEKLYLEHVTNYIYTHPEKFNVRFLSLPKQVNQRKDIRLTIDTKEDFLTCKRIYKDLNLNKEQLNINKLISFIEEDGELLKNMDREIKRNSK